MYVTPIVAGFGFYGLETLPKATKLTVTKCFSKNKRNFNKTNICIQRYRNRFYLLTIDHLTIKFILTLTKGT